MEDSCYWEKEEVFEQVGLSLFVVEGKSEKTRSEGPFRRFTRNISTVVDFRVVYTLSDCMNCFVQEVLCSLVMMISTRWVLESASTLAQSFQCLRSNIPRTDATGDLQRCQSWIESWKSSKRCLRTKDDSSVGCCKGGVDVYADERIPALGLPINLKYVF